MKPLTSPAPEDEPSSTRPIWLALLFLALVVLNGLLAGCANRPPPAVPVNSFGWRHGERGWYRSPVVDVMLSPAPTPAPLPRVRLHFWPELRVEPDDEPEPTPAPFYGKPEGLARR